MTRSIKFALLCVFTVFAVFMFLNDTTSYKVRGTALGEPLGVPTGVDATDSDFSVKVGIRWNTIRGANLYRVYRNTTNNLGSATDIGTTAKNYFFDTTGTADVVYFYWVRAENGGTVSLLSSPDQGKRVTGTPINDPFSTLEPPPEPVGNPVTATKAFLGKTIFWDEQISSTGTMACGTCHRPAEGGGDPRTGVDATSLNAGPDNIFGNEDDIFGSPGVIENNANGTYSVNPLFKFNVQVTGRKTPSYLNAGYAINGLFWDGRATIQFRDPITNEILLPLFASLESQSAGPPVSPVEMGHTGQNWTQVAARLQASRPLALASSIPTSLSTWIDGRTYPELFQEAFGSPDVTPARIAMAVATHERTLFSDHTPLDREYQGIPSLTSQELAGQQVFVEQQCFVCHSGPLLTEFAFHNIGVRPQADDPGRFAVTGDPDDRGRFKTPVLRNLELHGPFMHNGRLNTVEDVVEFYNRGGDFPAPNVDKGLIHPLNLSPQERADLSAFMKRPLTDPRVQNELPPFDRPQLYTETNRVPVISGMGRAGTGAITPRPIALEPPLAGSQSFTVAVAEGLGNASAVVVIGSTDPGVGGTIPATGSFARVAVTLSGTGGGNGYGSVSLPVPASVVGQTFYGRWYVTDAAAANGFAVSRLFQFTVFGESTVPNVKAPFDFDGDGKTEVGIFRPADGSWWYLQSSDSQYRVYSFGLGSDRIVPGDYTGDGKTDIAIFRPSSGEWFIQRSDDNTYYSIPFGNSSDTPVPADYDGDGKADIAVYRDSTQNWFILNSGGGTVITTFGIAGDKPVVADYDGDGKADIAIFRPGPGEWWYSRSGGGSTVALTFGTSTDKQVQGDYTGDGKADVAFFRPSTGFWFIQRSEDNSFYSVPFGTTGDLPAPGDYDGDGRYDTTVFRPSSATWFSNRSTAGTVIVTFGINGDQPLPAAFVP